MFVQRSRITAPWWIAVLAAIVSGVLLPAHDAAAATFTVTSAADDGGPHTLRQAILNANNTPGYDTIVFNLPPDNQQTGTVTITPLSPLPHITEAVTISGTSQPGYLDRPLIEIRGDKAGAVDKDGNPVDGLFFDAGCMIFLDDHGIPNGRVESFVTGFVINRFSGAGIRIRGNCTEVVDNYIGTDLAGTLGEGNVIGIHIDSRNGAAFYPRVRPELE